MTKEEIAQWVIDNRYPKSENLKTSDFEIYHFLTAQIGIIASENERLKAEREWIKITPETMPKIPTINNYCIENKDLLVLHYLKFDSYEIGFWNGEKWEMPDTGFAEIEEVDMYMSLPQPPKQ